MKTYDKIILISLDTLRSDAIGSNPYKLYLQNYKPTQKIKKGELDRIISEGVFFPNTISVAPYTSASHAAYFTGKWQKNNGIYDQFNSTLKTETIFDVAKRQGYDTIFKTDFPLVLGKYLNFLGGVDKYFIEDEAAALNALGDSEKTMAFFHFGQIHYPYGFHSLRYGGDDYVKKVEELEHKYNITHGSIELEDMAVETFRDKEDLELLYRYKAVVSYLYTHKHDDELFDLYFEGINYFHEHVLNVFLKKLEESLEGQRYLIVIFGDHGEAWSDETYGHHNSSDEGVLRVPLIFKGTDISKAKLFSHRVRTIDLFPTLLEFMGNPVATYDGESLTQYINISGSQPVDRKDRPAFSGVWVNELKDILRKTDSIFDGKEMAIDERISIQYSACMYDGQYKYVRTYQHFANRTEVLEPYDTEHLYDLTDLKRVEEVAVAEHQVIVEKMRQLLVSYTQIDREQHDVSEQMRQYFKMQGYNV